MQNWSPFMDIVVVFLLLRHIDLFRTIRHTFGLHTSTSPPCNIVIFRNTILPQPSLQASFDLLYQIKIFLHTNSTRRQKKKTKEEVAVMRLVPLLLLSLHGLLHAEAFIQGRPAVPMPSKNHRQNKIRMMIGSSIMQTSAEYADLKQSTVIKVSTGK